MREPDRSAKAIAAPSINDSRPARRQSTTTALLAGLFDPANRDVWQEFDLRYRPMIRSFACRLGLSDADAEDAAQETMARFVRDYRAGRYDRQRGRLGSWIIGIVKHRVADHRRGRAARRERRGDSVLLQLPADDELAVLWDSERKQTILEQAIAELRDQSKINEKTIRAFEGYVIQERPAAEIASELGLSPHDVYKAKLRITDRLREIVGRLDQLFDDG